MYKPCPVALVAALVVLLSAADGVRAAPRIVSSRRNLQDDPPNPPGSLAPEVLAIMKNETEALVQIFEAAGGWAWADECVAEQGQSYAGAWLNPLGTSSSKAPTTDDDAGRVVSDPSSLNHYLPCGMPVGPDKECAPGQGDLTKCRHCEGNWPGVYCKAPLSTATKKFCYNVTRIAIPTGCGVRGTLPDVFGKLPALTGFSIRGDPASANQTDSTSAGLSGTIPVSLPPPSPISILDDPSISLGHTSGIY